MTAVAVGAAIATARSMPSAQKLKLALLTDEEAKENAASELRPARKAASVSKGTGVGRSRALPKALRKPARHGSEMAYLRRRRSESTIIVRILMDSARPRFELGSSGLGDMPEGTLASHSLGTWPCRASEDLDDARRGQQMAITG